MYKPAELARVMQEVQDEPGGVSTLYVVAHTSETNETNKTSETNAPRGCRERERSVPRTGLTLTLDTGQDGTVQYSTRPDQTVDDYVDTRVQDDGRRYSPYYMYITLPRTVYVLYCLSSTAVLSCTLDSVQTTPVPSPSWLAGRGRERTTICFPRL